MSMIGIDPEETAEALERDPGHQGAADLIRQMAARIAELETQVEGAGPGSARLLDCGFCYEEQGEEVHPHPECPVGRPAVSAGVSPATDQTAEAVASCPGRELDPNPCRCPCYGCKHNCAAHTASPAAGAPHTKET